MAQDIIAWLRDRYVFETQQCPHGYSIQCTGDILSIYCQKCILVFLEAHHVCHRRALQHLRLMPAHWTDQLTLGNHIKMPGGSLGLMRYRSIYVIVGCLVQYLVPDVSRIIQQYLVDCCRAELTETVNECILRQSGRFLSFQLKMSTDNASLVRACFRPGSR